jgi:hypothetical protein
MGVVVPLLSLYALLAWTGTAFLPLPKKGIRNGFIQDNHRKDCLRAVFMHVLILLLRVSGEIVVLLVTELLLKFSVGSLVYFIGFQLN